MNWTNKRSCTYCNSTLSYPISSSGYKFRKSKHAKISHANRILRSYGATTLQIHDPSGRPGQAPTLAYNRELYQNDGPPRGMIMQTSPSREFVAAQTGELQPSLQRHLGPARCRPGESRRVIPGAREGCYHRAGCYTPNPARALPSALHRAAKSAVSRSHPRPAPPPQAAATSLAKNFEHCCRTEGHAHCCRTEGHAHCCRTEGHAHY
jgi:hypothetical protein